jgi:iron complex outermembrane receptor protein
VTQHHAGAVAEEFPGQPKFKGQLSAGYETGPASVTAQLRFIGRAKLRNEWVEGVDVDDNRIGATAYLDLRGSYDFDIGGVETRLSIAVDNVFDTDPKIVPATVNTVPYGSSSPVTRLDIYDALGRSFRVGVRAKF